jgi:hypothetical protein
MYPLDRRSLRARSNAVRELAARVGRFLGSLLLRAKVGRSLQDLTAADLLPPPGYVPEDIMWRLRELPAVPARADAMTALRELSQVGAVAVVARDGTPFGVLSEEDIEIALRRAHAISREALASSSLGRGRAGRRA